MADRDSNSPSSPDKKYLRIREWMEIHENYQPGQRNAITDVPGVRVGQRTLISGESIRTGVTVLRPHEGDVVKLNCPAGVYVGNGYGKTAGTIQIEELGLLESFIGLTNTLAIAPVMQGLLSYHLSATSPSPYSLNVVVGETNDAYLNDIRAFPVKPDHVQEAIDALSEDVQEGAVGAGAGTMCFDFKGGMGTASRVIPGERIETQRAYTLGALVQTNFGGRLNLYGRPIPPRQPAAPTGRGSCMILLATDAPLDARLLKRLAKRGIAGMVAAGSYLGNGSGDICIAFSNCETNRVQSRARGIRQTEVLADGQMNPFFEAAIDAVREAIYNSLTMAETTRGVDGHVGEGLNLAEYGW